MEISFANRKLEKLCNSQKNMKADLGAENAKKLQQRLEEMAAVECLEDLRFLPGRCHELSGIRKRQLAVDLKHPRRLIFVPDHDPLPVRDDGGLDWSLVKRIQVVEIVDYH